MCRCGSQRDGADIMCFSYLFCACSIIQYQTPNNSNLTKHFFIRLPIDQRCSCSEHECESAATESFTTSLTTFISAQVCVGVYVLLCVCALYTNIWLACVWIKCYEDARIHWESISWPWQQREWDRQAAWDPPRLHKALLRTLEATRGELTPVYPSSACLRLFLQRALWPQTQCHWHTKPTHTHTHTWFSHSYFPLSLSGTQPDVGRRSPAVNPRVTTQACWEPLKNLFGNTGNLVQDRRC